MSCTADDAAEHLMADIAKHFNTRGVTTGRTSSSKPNMQNIPRERADEPLVAEAKLALLDELLAQCKAAGYKSVEIKGDMITAALTGSVAAHPLPLRDILTAAGFHCWSSGRAGGADYAQLRDPSARDGFFANPLPAGVYGL